MITLDFETRSFADLKKTGAWAYSQHPSTGVICACWGRDAEPIRSWSPLLGHKPPTDLFEAIEDGELIEAHNCAFEYSILANVLAPMGWPVPKIEQIRDTMACAAYLALPQKLENLARALGYQGKDPAGQRLITKYSKLHLKTAKTEIPEEVIENEWIPYCIRDVEIEQSVSDYLGDLPERELPNFHQWFRVNLRGLYLDTDGITAATSIVDQVSEQLTEEFATITSGLRPTQRDKVIAWFAGQGLKLDNMQGDYLEELLDPDNDTPIPQGPVRRALDIRLRINKASTKKLDAMANARGTDGRARFQTRYHGAATGRETGTGFQPLNLSRGFEKMDPEQLTRDIMYRDAGWLDMCYGGAMNAIGKASRNWIMAEPGNKIVAGDFVSIEAVILACGAGEQWKVEAFRNKEPIYERAAEKVFQLPAGTVKKETHPKERTVGKICELAFGFGGAVGAWRGFDDSDAFTDEEVAGYCKAWRRDHPATVQFWRDLQWASIDAVRDGKLHEVRGAVAFEMEDEWLTMVLPDGKRSWYFKPQIRMAMPRWHDPVINEDCAAGDCNCKPAPQLTYMAQKFGAWRRVSTYGGKNSENYTQSVSRQILMPASIRVEEAGYPVILGLYDELVTEVKEGFGSKEEFATLMQQSPGKWADGWPIYVDAMESRRYRK